uniref:N-acetylgalactosaminide beta-1,3-galactosyltransferase n=1 Tax=Culicoides sonorensis TaxID=179676 RepID=A0A336K9H2_CULSO
MINIFKKKKFYLKMKKNLKNYKYQRLPDLSTTKMELPELDHNHNIEMHHKNKDFIHYRSIMFGILIGLAFTTITILTLLPYLSINLVDMQSLMTSDTNTFFMTSEVIPTEDESSASNDIIVDLYDNVRILCMVFTHKDNYKEKAYWVNQTWGKRCNKLLFMSNVQDPDHLIDVTVLNINDTYDELWGKTKATFKYAYENYLNEFDWFFKADDDTYVIMENLRYLLYPYPIDLPLYFGFEFKDKYMSGGAGYLLSRQAVKLFVEKSLNDTSQCSPQNDGGEDWQMGRCLRAINVTIGDSRDEFLLERFQPLSWDNVMDENQFKDQSFWYYTNSYYKINRTGIECCSKTAITFHYMNRVGFLLFEFLIYNFKLMDTKFQLKELPVRYSKNDVDIMFQRKEIGLNIESTTTITTS